MPTYAVEALDDALDATRRFLTPVDRTRWLKLAVVAFFIAGPGGNLNSVQYSFGGDGDGGELPPELSDVVFTSELWILVGLAVVVALVIGLAFAFVGSVMEFVFIESLRNEAVTVRRYWNRRWRQGLRLLGFRILLGVLVLGSVALLAAPFVLTAIGTGSVSGGLPWLVFLGLLPFFLLFAMVLGVVNGFTTVFVVPIMTIEDGGVLDSWRRLWPTITAQWVQFLAYVVVSVFLSVLGAILVGVVTGVLAVLLLIPFGILGAIGAGLLFVFPPAGWAVIAVVALLFLLAVLVVVAIVQVPVQTYLRYYALLVLGDVEPEFDLIPDQRAAIRESVEEAG